LAASSYIYQMLTGELPFRGTPRMLLHQVLHDEPRRPRSFNDRIPRDLEAICLKAMAKEPGRRYATAAEAGADLRRFLAGEPIQARRVGAAEHAWRWCRRNPAVAGPGAAAFLAMALGTALSTAQAIRARRAVAAERAANVVARAREAEMRAVLEFKFACMLARKFTRAPGCSRQWAELTMKPDLSQNRPASSSLVLDGERYPVTTPLKVQAMTRWTIMVAAGIILGAVGITAARNDEKHETVRALAVREIAEKVDGKEANATAVEVTFEPGQAGASYRHPGPAFGYVLEGEYEWAIDDQPANTRCSGAWRTPGSSNSNHKGDQSWVRKTA
jgi:hypothetical protein